MRRAYMADKQSGDFGTGASASVAAAMVRNIAGSSARSRTVVHDSLEDLNPFSCGSLLPFAHTGDAV